MVKDAHFFTFLFPHLCSLLLPVMACVCVCHRRWALHYLLPCPLWRREWTSLDGCCPSLLSYEVIGLPRPFCERVCSKKRRALHIGHKWRKTTFTSQEGPVQLMKLVCYFWTWGLGEDNFKRINILFEINSICKTDSRALLTSTMIFFLVSFFFLNQDLKSTLKFDAREWWNESNNKSA